MLSAEPTNQQILRAYALFEGWRTYTMQDECTRMHRLEELSREISQRGLEYPEPIYSNED